MQDIHWLLRGCTTSEFAGRHNCALAVGVPLGAIGQGPSFAVKVVPVRCLRRMSTCTVIDDTYNANPDSVRAAIDVLAGLPGRTCWYWETWEVGEQGPQFHTEPVTPVSMALRRYSHWARWRRLPASISVQEGISVALTLSMLLWLPNGPAMPAHWLKDPVS